MKPTNPTIDAFLRNATRWRAEMRKLRAIALDCGLHEELKWGKPCYSVNHSTVAIIQPFKERCAFMFFKGALLHDPQGLLERPGENSQAARRLMFSGVDEIARTEPRLRAFVAEAIAFENAGAKVRARKGSEPVPRELRQTFKKLPRLKKSV